MAIARTVFPACSEVWAFRHSSHAGCVVMRSLGCCSLRNVMTLHTYQAHIYVTLRPSVLDPAGTAVQSGLKQMGHTNVSNVRIGKFIELTVQAATVDEASQQVDRVCDQLLANPVIENYRFDLKEQSSVQTTAV